MIIEPVYLLWAFVLTRSDPPQSRAKISDKTTHLHNRVWNVRKRVGYCTAHEQFFFFFICFVFCFFLWKSLLLPTDGMGWTKLFQRATHLKPQLLVDSLVKKYESITEEKSQGEFPLGTDEARQICPKWQMASCIPALIHLFPLDFAPNSVFARVPSS